MTRTTAEIGSGRYRNSFAARSSVLPLHTPTSPGMAANCTESYFEQRVDHFGPNKPDAFFRQRYFIYDGFYKRRADSGGGNGGPMFFYLGNEADVTLYVNATGLMWENAEEFGALLVFAEHRYYGKSQMPFPSTSDGDKNATINNLRFLSAEQAIMDYVVLIRHLKERYGFDDSDAVIGFGGSYGGMLASWARLKYPHVWDGAIAASAPIVSFEGMDGIDLDFNFYAEGVTYDVTVAAGASEHCETNLRKAFADLALTKLDPALVRRNLRVCDADNTTDADLGTAATFWLDSALSYMAMGNFPYPSRYILNGNGELPAFPVRVACQRLANNMTADDQVNEWLLGLADFAGVYYNNSRALECNVLSAPVNPESEKVNELWNYQYCSQIFQVFGHAPGKNDMYWDAPWDGNATAKRCYEEYGFWPDRYHFALSYGTPVDWARDGASNIVWSQGEYDPWRGGGVTTDLSRSLKAVVISEAAHHLDLFFSHENDTEHVIAARRMEMDQARAWIDEKRPPATLAGMKALK